MFDSLTSGELRELCGKMGRALYATRAAAIAPRQSLAEWNARRVALAGPGFKALLDLNRWQMIEGAFQISIMSVAGTKADGEMGEGQREWGWGYTRYLEEIDRMERFLSTGSGDALRDVLEEEEEGHVRASILRC